jgi:hypothetical protein
LCSFEDSGAAVFASFDIARAVTPDVEPLFVESR